MKRELYLCGLAFVISLVAYASFVSPVLAYMDEDERWDGYAYALVRGSWRRIGYPYYSVYHKGCVSSGKTGWTNFIGWGQYGVLYNNIYPLDGNCKDETPPFYNQVWAAGTYTFCHQGGYAVAFIGPPGAQ